MYPRDIEKCLKKRHSQYPITESCIFKNRILGECTHTCIHICVYVCTVLHVRVKCACIILHMCVLLQYKPTPRLRTSTAPARPVSSTRSGRKKEQPVPEFMKEFKSKKKSTA